MKREVKEVVEHMVKQVVDEIENKQISENTLVSVSDDMYLETVMERSIQMTINIARLIDCSMNSTASYSS